MSLAKDSESGNDSGNTTSCADVAQEKELKDSPQCASGTEVEESYITRKERSAQGIWGRVKAVPSGCWEWQGATASGYSLLGIGRKQLYRGHRLIFQIFHGSLARKDEVCHSCDNPRCLNPTHLFLGSHSENMMDCVAKGRHGNSGINHALKGTPIFSDEKVFQIRTEYVAAHTTPRKMAEKYGIAVGVMRRLLRGRTYAWVPMPSHE